MGKRRDWPSPEKVAEMLASIRAREPEILVTHHLVGLDSDPLVVMVNDGRPFDILGDDDYLRTLAGVLKAAGKPVHVDIDAVQTAMQSGALDE